MTSERTGILLLNLGTPESPSAPDVRRFLREFLSDPYVIALPNPLRWLLLHGLILPFRTNWSTRAYQKIWTEQGSPLLIHSQKLQSTLQDALGDDHVVELAMRYGKPDITAAIDRLLSKNCQQLMVIPLYPQYSESTSESSIQKTKRILKKHAIKIPVTFLGEFYYHPTYIEANVELIKKSLNGKTVDKIIFSYHGLPEQHIHKVCHEKEKCDLKQPCPAITNNNQKCYRAQCYTTSHLIAEKLGATIQRIYRHLPITPRQSPLDYAIYRPSIK